MTSEQQLDLSPTNALPELSIDCHDEEVVTLLASLAWDVDVIASCLLSPTSLLQGTPASSSTPQVLWGDPDAENNMPESFDVAPLQFSFPSLDPSVDMNNNDINADEVSSMPVVPPPPPPHRAAINTQEEFLASLQLQPSLSAPKTTVHTSPVTQNTKKRPNPTSMPVKTKKRAKIAEKKLKGQKKMGRIDVSALRNRILYDMATTSHCLRLDMETFART
ncbi:uncharacterized protein LOC106179821 [Lingula anatina]|uniref:Uncharacterized protein LOC106179821 n=1 Tax=Lingula anatina TaxID=7574 RepID=A0A1S3K8T7_LINAN|nr:uncharacterized protein LOC106179821 [Lingula anatina]|eukprot:XP_013419050.1 uncharacterized protein LOC106179821 [Lingula anatina]